MPMKEKCDKKRRAIFHIDIDMNTSNILWHSLLCKKNNNSQICARAFSMPVTETATNIQCSMFQRLFSLFFPLNIL